MENGIQAVLIFQIWPINLSTYGHRHKSVHIYLIEAYATGYYLFIPIPHWELIHLLAYPIMEHAPVIDIPRLFPPVSCPFPPLSIYILYHDTVLIERRNEEIRLACRTGFKGEF